MSSYFYAIDWPKKWLNSPSSVFIGMCKETNFNGSNSNDPSVFLFCATDSIDLTAYTSTQRLRECIKSNLFGSVKLIAKFKWNLMENNWLKNTQMFSHKFLFWNFYALFILSS